MTEDSVIRIVCDSAEFVHVPHTWSSSFAQNPRNLSQKILGTSPVGSELDIPNETDIPRAPLPPHRHAYTSQVLGSPVSSRHDHRMAPTIAWPKTCPKRGRVPITKLAVKATAVYPAKATAARSPPTLVKTRKESPPVDRIKACPYRQLWLHEKSSVRWHLVNVQIRFMNISTCSSYHEHATK